MKYLNKKEHRNIRPVSHFVFNFSFLHSEDISSSLTFKGMTCVSLLDELQLCLFDVFDHTTGQNFK